MPVERKRIAPDYTGATKSTVGLSNVANLAPADLPVSTATQTALDLKDRLDPNLLTTGEATIPRNCLSQAAVVVSSGSLRLTYFTARRTETTTQVRAYTGNTAAAATPTLCQLALFSIDGAGAGTQVAITANNTANFAAANTAYPENWTTPYAKVAGQRYAVGILVITAGATPTFCGSISSGGSILGSILARAPRMTGTLGSQASMPASFADASLTAGVTYIYSEILP